MTDQKLVARLNYLKSRLEDVEYDETTLENEKQSRQVKLDMWFANGRRRIERRRNQINAQIKKLKTTRS